MCGKQILPLATTQTLTGPTSGPSLPMLFASYLPIPFRVVFVLWSQPVGECRSAKEPKDTFIGSSQW